MALFYLILFVVIVIFFVAMLIYGTQEKSYEQALEEQRSKNNDLLLSSSGKNETVKKETKKDKLKKGKDITAKKSKDKTSVHQAPKSVTSKEQTTAKTTLHKEIAPPKVETIPQPDVVDQAPSITSVKQLPHRVKDVLKKTEAKQIARESEVIENLIEKASNIEALEKVEKIEKSSTVVKAIQKPVDVKATEQPKVNNKKNKRSISKVSKELSFEDILESVNSSYFSDDDITRLTDALLNRQADEQKTDYNWHKKNDPVEALQKQLSEKKELIDQQTKNMEAVKKKSEVLLGEVQIFKKRFNKLEVDNDNLRKEIEYQKQNYGSMVRDIEVKSQQKFEQRLSEIRLEERNRAICEINALQGEVNRLTDIINNQTEGMKEKESGFDELANLNKQLETKNRELTEKITKIEEHLEDNVQQLNVLEQTRQKGANDYEEQIKKLQESNNLLEVKVQANEVNSSDIEAFTSQINSLKAELSNHVAQKEELNKIVSDLKDKNSTILTEKNGTLKDIDVLKAKLEELDNEKICLLYKLESLTNEKNSLTSKSDDLNNLIKTNDKKFESLLNLVSKLGISTDSNSLQKDIDDLKTKLSQYHELSSKQSDLNDLFEQVSNENASLKSQLESLKQENKDQVKKSQEFASALSETEKILSDLEAKAIKNKSDHNHQLADFEQNLSDKFEENEHLKEEISKNREQLENSSKINDNLNEKLKELKEHIALIEGEIALYKSKEESLEKILEENKNLNNKIVKLNNMVQIGKHSYQEESEKVQNLENIISLMNGKENSNLPTSNGNSNNLSQQIE